MGRPAASQAVKPQSDYEQARAESRQLKSAAAGLPAALQTNTGLQPAKNTNMLRKRPQDAADAAARENALLQEGRQQRWNRPGVSAGPQPASPRTKPQDAADATAREDALLQEGWQQRWNRPGLPAEQSDARAPKREQKTVQVPAGRTPTAQAAGREKQPDTGVFKKVSIEEAMNTLADEMKGKPSFRPIKNGTDSDYSPRGVNLFNQIFGGMLGGETPQYVWDRDTAKPAGYGADGARRTPQGGAAGAKAGAVSAEDSAVRALWEQIFGSTNGSKTRTQPDKGRQLNGHTEPKRTKTLPEHGGFGASIDYPSALVHKAFDEQVGKDKFDFQGTEYYIQFDPYNKGIVLDLDNATPEQRERLKDASYRKKLVHAMKRELNRSAQSSNLDQMTISDAALSYEVLWHLEAYERSRELNDYIVAHPGKLPAYYQNMADYYYRRTKEVNLGGSDLFSKAEQFYWNYKGEKDE
ncbi:MAG: hypothetical protein VB092_04885 [Oscillospiraceae bacterium]|nr:hypothetical protein [Oscillospiraceae bacterium]